MLYVVNTCLDELFIKTCVYTCTSSELLELAFDDTFVKTYQWSSILQAYSRVLLIKTSQRELLLMCIVMINSMLKALKHTHTS